VIRMKRSLLNLYSLAKGTAHEIILDAQLQSSGANQARLLEKFEKNKNYIRNIQIMIKVMFTIIFGVLAFIPLITYFQVKDFIENPVAQLYSIVLTSSILFSMYFLILILYLLLIGMLNASAMMSGSVFEWLETLPIDRKSLQKLSFLTIFRSLDLPLVATCIIFPVVMFIATQNFIVLIITSIISVVNVIFSFSLLVLIGERIQRVMNVNEINSKKATTLRMLTMLSYVIAAFGTSFVIQWAMSSIGDLFFIFSSIEDASILNLIFSIIPYPFGLTYLLSLIIMPFSIPIELWITTIIGFILSLIFVRYVYKSSIKALMSITSARGRMIKASASKVTQVKDIIIQIETKTPIKAYMRKDFLSATRDLQTFMFFIMPFIFPLISSVSIMSGYKPGDFFDLTSIGFIIFWVLSWFYVPMISIMLTSGFTGMDESGTTILSSLPLNPRDQAKAKLFLMLSIQTGSYLLPLIFFITSSNFIQFLLLFLASLPAVWILLLLFFQLKVRFFGRLRYKYVVEDVNSERKVLKYFVMILIEYSFGALLVLLMFLIMFSGELIYFIVIFPAICLSLLVILYFTFNRMFPKTFGKYEHNVMISFRERMRKIPFIGISILLLLYAIFLFLPDLIELPIIFILLELPYITLLFIDFLITFGIIGTLWLFLVPFKLHLPDGKKSFLEYIKIIHLSTVRPIGRNLFIGIICSIIAFLCFLGTGLILGRYEFNPLILFGNPNENTGAIGWFIFFMMLIPGIWEEVSFRGVMLPLLSKRYSQRSAIILNGVIFGLFHLLNLIMMILIGAPIILTFIQVIYASCLGFLFAYIYVKTESLLPSIIIHYLIDSVGNLFLNFHFDNIISVILFLVIGIGVLPLVFNFFIVKYIVQRKKPNTV